MHGKKIYYVLIFFTIALIGQSHRLLAQVKNGYIDLSNHNFEDSNKYLTGEWTFYKSQLLTPKEINDSLIEKHSEPLKVPSSWKDKTKPHLDESFGYGTYVIHIRTNPSIQMLSVNFNKVQSAYKLWINDSLYTEQIKVGKNAESTIPTWNSRNYTFLNQGNNEIVIQVSNFFHAKGGIIKTPYIGLPSKIEAHRGNIIEISNILMGVFFIMFLYYVSLFAIKRDEWAALYFGLLTLSTMIVYISMGELLITFLFPNLSWEAIVKTVHISNIARALTLALFFTSLHPTSFRKKTIKWEVLFFILYIVAVLILPSRIYSHFAIIIFVYTSFVMIHFGIITTIATIQKKPGAIYNLLAIIILFINFLTDVASVIFLLDIPPTLDYGILLLVLLLAFNMAYRNSISYDEMIMMTNKLLVISKIKDQLFSQSFLSPAKIIYTISSQINAYHTVSFRKINGMWIKTSEYYGGKIINFSKKFNKLNLKNKKLQDPSIDYELIKSCLNNKKTCYQYTKQTKKQIKKYGRIFDKVCLPIMKENEVISILYSQNTIKGRFFTKNTDEILETLKPQFSIITQNSIVFDELLQFNKALEKRINDQIEEITQQQEEIKTQKEEIEDKNKILQEASQKLASQNSHINDSINYAKRIQGAVLPTKKELAAIYPNNYVIFKPKRILSGDFYWANTLSKNDTTYQLLAVGDATGYGVPGALMSIIGCNILDNAIFSKAMYKPSDILDDLDERLYSNLAKKDNNKFSTDGITIGILSRNTKTGEILYAGAYHPLYIYTDNELKKYESVKKQAGAKRLEINKKRKYFDHKINIKHGTIFLCTDGFLNQLGENRKKIFYRNSFKELLKKTAQLPFNEQSKYLQTVFQKAQGNEPQTDDLLILTIKI